MTTTFQCQEEMAKKSWATILIVSTFATIALCVLGLIIWATSLNQTIHDRLAGKRWASPTDYYSAPERFLKGQSDISKIITSTLDRLGFQAVLTERDLKPGEFSRWTIELCKKKTLLQFSSDVSFCWAIKPHLRTDETSRPLQIVAVSDSDTVVEVYDGDSLTAVAVIELEPELFAQFYGGQPVLRQIVSIRDVPPALLNAILAIEDNAFLTHYGVSWRGMLRAAFRNITRGHVAEGGSTITQQLIKNYFLTSQRTFKRKFTEIIMALLLESQFTKDEILETYINEVYLGQMGPFEIHGVGMASKYLFNKRASNISLAESALIAGSIQSPRRYVPFIHPENALVRRAAVLKKMLELKLIDQSEFQSASNEPLPLEKKQLLRDQAPFFIDSVKYQLKKLGIDESEGLQVFTTLNIRAQQAATEAVISGLTQLEFRYASIQKLEAKYQAKLQGVLISADPTNGFVSAVVGGRSYGETQLNRAVQSRRQVGSTFKPFVYLAALTNSDGNGEPFTPLNPLTPVLDEKFKITYEGQTWFPQNFDEVYEGQVPLFRALEESLNAATARVEMQVGIKKVIEMAKRAGIDSPLNPVPSLALGSADLAPLEILQAYSTMAFHGELNPLTFIYKAMTTDGKILYEFKPARSQAIDAVDNAVIVSMLEGVLSRGTGRGIKNMGFTHPAAGKTGTTSDLKDAWFAGFTPLHSAVVWVGFDQPQGTGLTGALGAIPIWTNYMKAYASRYPPISFQIPDGAVGVTTDPESSMIARADCPKKVPLVFRKGTEPKAPCWLVH